MAATRAADRPPGPVAPERFGVLQSLLAYLLAACGEEREAVIPARELIERFSIPPEALEEHLSLLNLVNFGGGCYAVYAELHGDEVHVDKELFGDTFRGPPRLTPLEARAIRLALEFVGPMIAAGAHSPLDRVRAKLEETFGVFELDADARAAGRRRGGPRRDAHARDRRPEGRRARVPQARVDRGDARARSSRTRSSAGCRTGTSTPGMSTATRRAATGSTARARRRRCASGFTPRDGFDPAELQQTTTARIWYSPEVARWEVEKGAIPLVDGSAVSERAVGSPEWLIGEVLSFRGEAVVLAPLELRARVADRARELERELRPRAPGLAPAAQSVNVRPARAPTRPRACRRAPRRSTREMKRPRPVPGLARAVDAAELLEDQLLVARPRSPRRGR